MICISILFIRALSKSHKPLRRLEMKIGEHYRILLQVASWFNLPITCSFHVTDPLGAVGLVVGDGSGLSTLVPSSGSVAAIPQIRTLSSPEAAFDPHLAGALCERGLD